MEETNVNRLNGIPNFGHGLPENGEVIAGVTDIPQPLQDLSASNMDNDEKENVEVDAEENVGSNEGEAEAVNG